MLTDDATVAAWHNQGLPNDRMSTENAVILTTSERWPLIIDPQQQGIKWIQNRVEGGAAGTGRVIASIHGLFAITLFFSFFCVKECIIIFY